MQFWQPYQTCFCGRPKILHARSENHWQIKKFFNTAVFAQILSRETFIGSLITQPKFFDNWPKNSIDVRKRLNKLYSSKSSFFPSKSSNVRIKCSFDKTTENFLIKAKKSSILCPKMLRKQFLFKKTSFQHSYRQVGSSFNDAATKFSSKIRTFSLNVQNWKTTAFSKIYLCSQNSPVET